jgi:hypothetical protein
VSRWVCRGYFCSDRSLPFISSIMRNKFLDAGEPGYHPLRNIKNVFSALVLRFSKTLTQ